MKILVVGAGAVGGYFGGRLGPRRLRGLGNRQMVKSEN